MLKLRALLTPEQEILQNRLSIGILGVLGCYFFEFDTVILAAFGIYIFFNSAFYIMQKYKIWQDHERWLAAILIDALMAFTAMLREPEHMSIFYPLLLWVTLGNGFRFGLKWLYVAAGLSTVAFGIVVATTAYWQPNQILGYSLTGALLVIPAYCSTLIRRISDAKEQAEIASRAKSYFLASVSHELRTPLNAIIGYGNHLRQTDMPRNQKEMIEASVLAGEHLLHLIEQLIEVAKSGTGSTVVKSSVFSPIELLAEIRAIMAVKAEEKGLLLQLQAEPLTDCMIDGPTEIVRNILLNLIGNAIKFTEAGTISINSGIKELAGKNSLWFTVSDTGIGIAEVAIDRIFQPFQQADETVMNRFGGTGLGLAICKQLVEQVNGKISATSTIGQGSTFRIEIPFDLRIDQTPELQTKAQSLVRIIAFGEISPELLSGAQSTENFVVQHVSCQSAADMAAAISTIDLEQFNVALVAEHLTFELDQYSPVWNRFIEAEVAPVMVANDNDTYLEDIALRSAFSSILPPSPNLEELRSAIHIGCLFARHLRLPQPEDLPDASTGKSRKILVADDNRTNRNVLAAILEAAGHEVAMATDGDEALDALKQSYFDILLLDINMPRLNGIETCMMWRKNEGDSQHLPIVGVTADATAETEQNCINAGMDLRLTKPINAKLLLATIDRFCSGNDTGSNEPDTGEPSDVLDVVVPLLGITTSIPNAIDPAQIDYLMSIGDANFVTDMIEGFFEDIEQIIQPLQQSVENIDISEFHFCAHAIKSSGNNMGAKHLAELCSKFEKISETDFIQHRHIYLGNIQQELQRTTQALQELSACNQKDMAVNQR